jgi:uridine kinase
MWSATGRKNRSPPLKEAIAGYQQFLKLTQNYADGIIHRSRQNRNDSKKL